jgi:hypothetical protein
MNAIPGPTAGDFFRLMIPLVGRRYGPGPWPTSGRGRGMIFCSRKKM